MGDDTAFWKQAMKGLPWFRFLRQPVKVVELDDLFKEGLREEWHALKSKIEPGDKIWPFEIQVRQYLGMRKGYLVLRRGEPIGGIIHIVS